MDEPFIGVELSNYRVDSLLATGGMGRVYLASRQDGQFERTAAVKIMPGGMDEKTVRRFEQERKILASLNHPNIAQLYDAGIAPSGHLYLVMELVDGQPIDQYCETHHLSHADRIELINQLCSAIGFAHGKLVLHRDIKPSNVFVSNDGTLKLLDFGIAKIVESDEDVTQGATPMTPRYASPEQLQGQPVSVASDIYQTGILLYSLLTGEQPFGNSTLGDRLAQIDEQRAIEFSAADKANLPRDLRTIVEHCLSTDPNARYRNISDLQSDLRRFVQGFPITVSPPKTHQVFFKWIRRNLLSSAIAGALIASLAGSSIWYTLSLAESRETAEREARVATQIKNILIDLLRSGDPDVTQGETPTVLEVVQDGLKNIRTADIEDPEARVQVMQTLAEMLDNAGATSSAADVIEEARLLAEQNLGPDHGMTWNATNLSGNIQMNLGNYDAAELHFNQLLENIEEPKYDGRPRATLYNGISVLNWRRGNYPESISFGERAVAQATAALGVSDIATLTYQSSLGNHYSSAGRPRDSINLLNAALPIAEEALGEHSKIATAMHGNLASAHYQLLEIEETLIHLEAARASIAKVFGPDHPHAIREDVNLGIVYSDSGRFDEGRELIKTGIAKHTELLGPMHPMTIRYRAGLLTALITNEVYDEAWDECSQLLELVNDIHGDGHMYTLEARRDCAVAQFHIGDSDTASDTLKTVVTDMREIAGPDYAYAKELEEYMQHLGIN